MEQERQAFAAWSAPVATRVEVVEDTGTIVHTATRSMPWKTGDGSPLILLVGFASGYLLTRVRVLPVAVETPVVAHEETIA